MRKNRTAKPIPTLLIAFLIAGFLTSVYRYQSANAAVANITSLGIAFTENFDGIGNSGTATLPTGWRMDSGTPTVLYASAVTTTTQAAGTTGIGAINGSSTGGAYNFADGITASSTDRAVGWLSSTSFTSPRQLFVQITNNTAVTVDSLDIAYDIEKYRSGSRAWGINFFSSNDGSSWTARTAGDQSYPADANNTTVFNPPSTISKALTITGLSIAPGANFFLRWSYTGSGGSTNAQGLGIDNFSVTANVTTLLFRSAASGNWNANATWETSTDGSNWVAATQTPTSANGAITIRNPHAVSITANVNADQLTVDSGGALSVDTGVTLTLDNGGGSDLTNNGIVTLNGDLSAVSGATLNAAGGTVNYFKVANGQNVLAANYFLLAFSGGSKVLPAGTIGIEDTFNPAATSGHTITGNTIDYRKSTGSQVIAAFDYNNLTNTGSGSRILVNGAGTIRVAGTFSTGGGVHSPTASTFEYNGASAQVMPSQGYSYNVLSINNPAGVSLNAGGATVTASGGLNLMNGPFNLTTSGDLTLGNGIVVDRSGGSLNMAPTFSTNVQLLYSGFGSITTGPEVPMNTSTLSNMTIASAAGVTLAANTQCNGVLTLTSDLTVPEGLTFTQTGTSAGAGDVVGVVRRNDVSSTTRSFGNPNVQITETAGTISSLDVRLQKGNAPGGFPGAVLRTYSLEPALGTVIAATVRFPYLDAELNSNDESLLTLWRASDPANGTWENKLFTSRDTTGNWVELVGVTSFSTWTLADGVGANVPTAVRLTKFNGSSFGDGVQLNWESGYEVNNLGYHVYREESGKRSRITPALVAGSALTVGQGNKLTAGYSYSWFDPQGTPSTAYYLEAVDLDGSRQVHGPLYPYGMRGKNSPRRERALLLNEIAGASNAGRHKADTFYPGSMTDAKASNRENAAQVKPQLLTTQQVIAAGKAVKISVGRSGWHRITQPQLLAAGLDAASDARRLQLYVDGEEIPIRLTNEAPFGPSDTLEFYGVALNSPTSEQRVHYLINGTTPGKRITAKRLKTGDKNWIEVGTQESFAYTVERREKLLYSAHLLNGDAENIFGAPVLSEPVNQTLQVRNFDVRSAAQSELEVELQGLTQQVHGVRVEFNGKYLGAVYFGPSEHAVGNFTIDRVLIREGENTVTLVSTNGESDISFIDSIRLSYPHKYTVDDNRLEFSMPGNQLVRVDGFTTANIRVVDITNPNAPQELFTVAVQSGSGYAIKVQPIGVGQRTLLAFADHLVNEASSITANQPSNWSAAANGADFVVLTHKNFRQAIAPLVAQRRNEGLSTVVIDVEDVYDEFSFGAHTPAALKSFLMNAVSNWSRKPRYLLLVGDSSWDPKNYLGQGDNDFVPTKLIDTSYMETSSDDWLVDFSGAGLPQMAIGRLPGRSAGEISLMVSKILAYQQERETNAPLRGAVMVADTDFETESNHTRNLLPEGLTIESIDRSQVSSDDLMRGAVLDALNAGPMLVNYYGHGSVRVWTGAGIFDADLAANLTNANHTSLFVLMTCLNGYANDAYVDSLSESALKAPNGGAVAVWSSSGFTDSAPQFEMNTAFYRLMFGTTSLRLGEAAQAAKAATLDQDVRRTWTLFGDPTMRLR